MPTLQCLRTAGRTSRAINSTAIPSFAGMDLHEEEDIP